MSVENSWRTCRFSICKITKKMYKSFDRYIFFKSY